MEAKAINEESQVAQISEVKAERADPKKWLLVYTEFGYAEVNLEKFRAQLDQMAKESAEMQENLREYFEMQYAELVQQEDQKFKAEAELASAKEEEEKRLENIKEQSKAPGLEEANRAAAASPENSKQE